MTKQHTKDMGSYSFVQYPKTVIFTSLFSVIYKNKRFSKKCPFEWNFRLHLVIITQKDKIITF
jgi:hypothetical protein